MKIWCVILHYGNREDTLECIGILEKKAGTEVETAVVNNACDSELEYFLKTNSQDTLLLSPERNLGYAGGNNFAVRELKGSEDDLFFFLNNDAFVVTNTVRELAKVSSSCDCISGPVIYSLNSGKIESAGIYLNMFTGRVRHILKIKSGKPLALSGTAIMVSRKNFEKAGGFNEDYFLYMEDVEFCLRAAEQGIECNLVPEAGVFHRGRGAVDLIDSALPVYYSVRNHLRMLTDRMPLSFPKRQFRIFMVVIYYLLYSIFRAKGSKIKMIKYCLLGAIHFRRGVTGQVKF